MKFNLLFSFAISILLFTACKTTQQTEQTQTVDLPLLEIKPANEEYRASYTRYHDLIHTSLDIKFDWNKKHVLGKATITGKPYFYSTNTLQLDAKGFDVHEVALLKGNQKQKLNYSYIDNRKLNITLDKEYTRNDEYTIFIDYTAKPDELPKGGSEAISGDKGLYFINTDGSDTNKPRQIWTQGETEASSAWYPTFDSPNERMTQEIFITVDTQFVTLSNGLMINSKTNGDGTRTDQWKQTLPHAPYLFMIAVGDYAVVKDTWRDKQVNYYVEHKFEPYARQIFNHTPEMLEFFSTVLNFDYIWDKYSQVVVRDYVSGAMENTGAVIFGEFVQATDRELLDQDYEDIVSHELFHHWFGNVVTCESWSNLPLNESFATYGEYLWSEYKHGRDEADLAASEMLNQYLQESKVKKVDMIRYHYEDKEDMFDAHSYQKGGRILHMLRKTVGDSAFFKSLNLYLEKNKFQAVEIHHLRLAFEEVTGKDMNWFFNQWFLNAGHPDLDISYSYNENNKMVTVFAKQKQDLTKFPLYKLPVAVDVYTSNGKTRHEITVTKENDEIELPSSSKPLLVNFDAEKMLLVTKKDNKTKEEFIYQFHNAPLYLDRLETLQFIGNNYEEGSASADVIMKALNDKFWHIRQTAIRNTDVLAKNSNALLKQKLMELATKDEESSVRASAIRQLSKFYKDDGLTQLYKNAINDRAYSVISAGLNAMIKVNKEEGLALTNQFRNEENSTILNALAGIYSELGDAQYHNFYLSALEKMNGFEKYTTIQSYATYLTNSSEIILDKGVLVLEKIGRNDNPWWIRLSAVQALESISQYLDDIDKTRKSNVDKLIADIKQQEKEAMLVKIYGNMN